MVVAARAPVKEVAVDILARTALSIVAQCLPLFVGKLPVRRASTTDVLQVALREPHLVAIAIHGKLAFEGACRPCIGYGIPGEKDIRRFRQLYEEGTHWRNRPSRKRHLFTLFVVDHDIHRCVFTIIVSAIDINVAGEEITQEAPSVEIVVWILIIIHCVIIRI